MSLDRLARLSALLTESEFGALVLNPGPTLTYLTGLHFHLSERPTVLIVLPNQKPVLILPELEMGKLAALGQAVQPFSYGDNPETWLQVFRQACSGLGLTDQQIGLEPTRFRFLEMNLIQSALPWAKFTSAEGLLNSLRMHKDAGEIALMRKAVDIAQEAYLKTIPLIRVGVTEREIAAELSQQLLKAGSDSEMPFNPIVASGPNSANPHAVPSDRAVTSGDLIVIDWGASYQGYVSDLTRTVAIGPVEAELQEIAAIVLKANRAGCEKARPGIAAGLVDQATRAVINRAEYGPYFFHRTGHGIGMEGHEPPYIFGDNKLILAPGMAFTVEPGIYLTGRGGVRIEDNVIITETGAEVLSDLPRELQIL